MEALSVREQFRRSQSCQVASKALAYLLTQGWTMRAIAEYAKVPPGSLRNIRYGMAFPSTRTIDKLLELAGFTLHMQQTTPAQRPPADLVKGVRCRASERKARESKQLREDPTVHFLSDTPQMGG